MNPGRWNWRRNLFTSAASGLLAALWLAYPSVLGAQTQGIWHVYLNGNQINALTARGEDIWAATGGGAVCLRADGNFQQWNRARQGLLSDSVDVIALDHQNRLWLGTERAGISILDPSSEKWTPLTSLSEPIPGDQIQAVRISGTAEAETTLVGTALGFALFVNGESRDVCLQGVDICGLPSNDVRDLLVLGDSLWIATAGGAVVRYPAQKEKGWRQHSDGLGSTNLLHLARADSLYASGATALWVWRESQKVWTPARDPEGALPAGFRPTAMLTYRDTLWVAGTAQNLSNGGVFRRVQGVFRRVGQALPEVTSLARTTSGKLYLGQADPLEVNDGIWSLEGTQWVRHHMPGPSVRAGYVAMRFDDGGALWLSSVQKGTPPMISRLQDDQWSFFPGGQGRSNQSTYDIVEARGSLWLAHCCCGGALDDQVCGMEKTKLDGSSPSLWPVIGNGWTLDLDSKGYLWVGTNNHEPTRQHGIFRINMADSTWVQVTHEGTPSLVSDNISAVRVQGRIVWVGYVQNGLSRWDLGPDGQPLTTDDQWTSYTAADNNLINDSVTRIEIAPDGRIWIGTDGGLSIFNGASFTNVGPGFGQLPAGHVNAVVPTDDDGAWVATKEGGLTHMIPQQFGYTFDDYGAPDIPNPSIEDMTFGPDGRTLWLATDRGLARFSPQQPSSGAGGQVSAVPNPFRYNCSKDGAIKLFGAGGTASGVVCDLSGRVVARFENRSSDDLARSEAVWNGRVGSRDGAGGGAFAAPGLYIIRASSPTGVHTIGVAVMDADCNH